MPHHLTTTPAPRRRRAAGGLAVVAALACAAAVPTTASAMTAMAMSGSHGAAAHQPGAPARGDRRFLAGSTGPTVGRGMAPTLRIPDGAGFGGERGRRQNRGDRRKDNYSVTDANFTNHLGLLARNPDTGVALTYVEHIQTYAAAGYLETYAPATYAQLVANQDAGRGTVLGAAAHLMGLVITADPAEADVDPAAIPTTIPGTPLSARAVVRSPRDATGQAWARMHHAETSFAALRGITALGVPWQQAMILAGDDGISGAGRVNGMNTQAGPTGFDRDELTVYELAANIGATTGKPVVAALLRSHDHDGMSTTALSMPHVDRLLRLPLTDRSLSSTRVARLVTALRNGTLERAQRPAPRNPVLRVPPASTVTQPYLPLAAGTPHATKFVLRNRDVLPS